MNTKQLLRNKHIAYRRSLRPTKATLDTKLVEHILACMDAFGARGQAVAAYNPLPSEPGPGDLAARLAEVASPVWLPITLSDGVLAWAEASANTTPGALGVAEPGGARFNSNVLRSCKLILAPALAVDTSGMRLGKGAGYYDRALHGLDTPVAAVVFAEELVDHVPAEPHDVPVDAVITPEGFRLF
jgi:5-formyltetrahydrofolate cyclo-ligase